MLSTMPRLISPTCGERSASRARAHLHSIAAPHAHTWKTVHSSHPHQRRVPHCSAPGPRPAASAPHATKRTLSSSTPGTTCRARHTRAERSPHVTTPSSSLYTRTPALQAARPPWNRGILLMTKHSSRCYTSLSPASSSSEKSSSRTRSAPAMPAWPQRSSLC